MMRRLAFITALIVSISGCGMSNEEKERTAQVTCSIMGETAVRDAAIRVEKVNEARKEIGEGPYLSGDEVIADSLRYGLCPELVLNDPSFGNLLAEAKRSEAEEIEKTVEQLTMRAEAIPLKAKERAKEISKIFAEQPDERLDSTYIELERPFIAYIKGSELVMEVKIAIMTQYGERVVASLETHDFEIRSEILGVMRAVIEADLLAETFPSDLSGKIKVAINSVLEKHEDFAGVEDVAFTQFVIQ